ncbi:ribonuclease H-like domain-containing protein [Calycina marina]|uniref:Ribonuclease H-like domain-containing protein n=1 Tax=Calycina marina TaxID=1763456 RepID=A0A9P7Z914_9HELO|nr:ribonuclease H-like domain-containing protein [Calycina marina]
MKPVGPHFELLTEKIAIDCEMMRSNIGQVVGRVSVINYESKTIFDTFVCYPEPIIIKNTEEKYSGISCDDIDPEKGALSFPEVQCHLLKLLSGRIVVGHDIRKDLNVISMNLPSQVQRLQGCRRYLQFASRDAHHGPSLKNLAKEVLGRPIKQSRVSSVEDAVATMELYRNAEADIEQEQGK